MSFEEIKNLDATVARLESEKKQAELQRKAVLEKMIKSSKDFHPVISLIKKGECVLKQKDSCSWDVRTFIYVPPSTTMERDLDVKISLLGSILIGGSFYILRVGEESFKPFMTLDKKFSYLEIDEYEEAESSEEKKKFIKARIREMNSLIKKYVPCAKEETFPNEE